MHVKNYDYPEVCVLLAFYRGHKYIDAQLCSILEQDYPGQITVLVRDDEPTQENENLISNYLAKSDNRLVQYIRSDTSSKGHLENFSALCELGLIIGSKYFFFSDQDDVWLPNKVEIMVNELLAQEKGNSSLPILVHSDLTVVDEKLKIKADSFHEYQGFPDTTTHSFPELCCQNTVTGCASAFNLALLKIATPIPKKTITHDHWFALCAKLYGQLIHINHPLLLYRQHEVNSIGAVSLSKQQSMFNSYIYKTIFTFPKRFICYIYQSRELLKVDGLVPQSESSKEISRFIDLPYMTLKERIRYIRLVFPHNISTLKWTYLLILFLFLPFIFKK